ncbi:archaetidylserine decarboxylase [Salinisphaera sp. Q1T1-3]|uniref:archaetidylserine decarboxylase n=1 Tax=Salinisphaera sp. Q1T1-3 TaxID=2321229 RepID=UPI000E75C661|nr:archaetidylserine decarboxylase [Salinisphaera sp. Q1T1-3]RJS95016.1 phosphatidylserine decarboxylase [Salinisphaera sp. Q1T1-3]
MSAPLPATTGDRIFATTLGCLPTRAISRAALSLAGARRRWLKNALIRAFLKGYPAIDMSEAAEPDAYAYDSFNAFFTRRLASGARPAPDDATALVCPVDGTLGALGDIEAGQLFQTKGVAYDVASLLDDSTLAARFTGGRYATFYLAPSNYHRVHMPSAGRLQATRYVPGRLFGVNPRCVRAVSRLFARNERLVSLFETENGPMALVLVGAFIVGGIHDVATGRVCPPHRRAARAQRFNPADHAYERGDEMGHFCLGSSVIALFGADVMAFDDVLAPGMPVKLNAPLGHCR